VITGILNLIPYVGITLAGLLSILATLSGSTDLSIIAGVLVVNVIVQFFDNNILVPLVVSSKVKINAFVSLVSIITGGAIGGVAGMFLAIPLIALLKVVFDRIDFLEPWGFVMGDNLPKNNKVVKIKIPFWGKKTK
jgi:predicted PurR-regulated permease PerM